jgi:hypothetical protein
MADYAPGNAYIAARRAGMVLKKGVDPEVGRKKREEQAIALRRTRRNANIAATRKSKGAAMKALGLNGSPLSAAQIAAQADGAEEEEEEAEGNLSANLNGAEHVDDEAGYLGPPAAPAALGKRMPELNPFIQFIIGIADTIHDMWGGYRNRAGGGEIDIMLTTMFKNEYTNLCTGYRLEPPVFPRDSNIGSILGIIFTHAASIAATAEPTNYEAKVVASIPVSDIEDATIDFIESVVKFIDRKDPTSNYVLSAPVAFDRTKDSLTISPGEVSIKGLTAPDKLRIANTVLEYFFNNPATEALLTFDAGAGIVGKIFKDHGSARGLILPQNIADSATTTFARLGEVENMYVFPADDAGNFYSKNNVLTKYPYGAVPPTEMGYNNTGFTDKSPFSFSIVAKTGPATIMRSFGPKEKQGPSLDYLLDLHLTSVRGGDPTIVAPTSACLEIGKSITPDFFAAIQARIRASGSSPFICMKRGGDADQCRAASMLAAAGNKVILVTIDRLCALLGRLLGLCVILHYGETMTLYKNKITDATTTPEQAAAALAARDERFVRNYTPLYTFYNNTGNVGLLTAFIDSIRAEKAAVAIPSIQGKSSGKIVELLQQRLDDIITYLTNIGGFFQERGAATKANIEAFLSNATQNKVDTNTLSDLQNLLEARSLFSLDKKYPFLKFNFDDYRKLYSAAIANLATVSNPRPSRTAINYYNLINNDDGFNYLLGKLHGTFLAPPAAGYTIAQIPKEREDKESIKGLLAVVVPPAAQGGGGRARQRGGALTAGQAGQAATDDLKQSFVEICADAGAILNQVMSTLGPARLGATGNFDTLAAALDVGFIEQKLIEYDDKWSVAYNDVLSAYYPIIHAAGQWVGQYDAPISKISALLNPSSVDGRTPPEAVTINRNFLVLAFMNEIYQYGLRIAERSNFFNYAILRSSDGTQIAQARGVLPTSIVDPMPTWNAFDRRLTAVTKLIQGGIYSAEIAGLLAAQGGGRRRRKTCGRRRQHRRTRKH